MTMKENLGKHLLIDCYGCKNNTISSMSALADIANEAIAIADIEAYDTHVHQTEHELTLTVIGRGSHIFIHSYPDFSYVAIDVFAFNADLNPTTVMKILRQRFRPDKIRATSVRRGKVDTDNDPDMKPKTKSKTTTFRRMKSTGQQLKQTGSKMLRVLTAPRKKK